MRTLVTYERKIRYSDTDIQGIVFNGNYFTYFDDALTDLFEVLGLTPEDLRRRGIDVVTAHAEADFIGSARIGDALATSVTLDRIGTTSIVFAMEGVVDDVTIVRGNVVWVTVDARTFDKVPVPDDLRKRLELAAGFSG
jgi:YbgC/YbaW family acyl-CoA thioester hydrolase